MEPESAGNITQLLAAIRSGSEDAPSRLAELVYQDLHRIARRRMAAERRGHSLQTTALVNEAYLQIVGLKDQNWQNRCHFFAVASKVMRQILVDHARAVRAEKRGGPDARAVPLDINQPADVVEIDTMLLVDAALSRLEKLDARQCRIVELRYFSGLTEDEVAEVLGISARTVKRDWQMARLFLRDQISGEGALGVSSE